MELQEFLQKTINDNKLPAIYDKLSIPLNECFVTELLNVILPYKPKILRNTISDKEIILINIKLSTRLHQPTRKMHYQILVMYLNYMTPFLLKCDDETDFLLISNLAHQIKHYYKKINK